MSNKRIFEKLERELEERNITGGLSFDECRALSIFPDLNDNQKRYVEIFINDGYIKDNAITEKGLRIIQKFLLLNK
jgi:hypothetical protein